MSIGTEPIGLFLLLRAFASGSVALTGTEAIANGVPAFKPPGGAERRDHDGRDGRPAGRAVRGHHDRRPGVPDRAVRGGLGRPDVIALVAQTAFGVGIAAVLRSSRGRRRSSCSSPRTRATTRSRASARCSPRTATCPASSASAATGSRSAGASSCCRSWPALLIIAFGGITTFLIPLYSVGVFVCFTISQAGMVRHWLRTREPGWRWRLALNATRRAVMTAVVLVVVASVKFFARGVSRRDPHARYSSG